MAKPTTVKIRLNSTADTGFFYVTKKNSRTMTEKMVVKKYDPVARKHVEFIAFRTVLKSRGHRSGFFFDSQNRQPTRTPILSIPGFSSARNAFDS